MDLPNTTKLLVERFQTNEPVHGFKILRYLLAQDISDVAIIELAFCPDVIFLEVIEKVKAELQLQPKLSFVSSPFDYLPLSDNSSSEIGPFVQTQLNSLSYSSAFVPAKHNSFLPIGTADPVNKLLPPQLFEDPSNEYLLSEIAKLSRRTSSHLLRQNENSVKTCYFFKKGHCKNGSNCKNFHGKASENINFDAFCEDQAFLTESLGQLESEIVGLLRTRKDPVPIASLPTIYYEMYGKSLQAVGYLTESQRHCKAGFSLTKLLARLKSIVLIERQHFVVLTEDAPKYMGIRSDRNDSGPIVAGSRQIYMTFPAVSTFSDKDVSSYFSEFGAVEDVRIPFQEKRMFGFVSFKSADTVKMVLAKGNPHYVCGSPVLVKPYREKQKFPDRKYQDKIDCPPCFASTDAELDSLAWGYQNHMVKRRQNTEKTERLLDWEMNYLRATRIPFRHPIARAKWPEGKTYMQPSVRMHQMLCAPDDDSENDEKIKNTNNNIADTNRYVLSSELANTADTRA